MHVGVRPLRQIVPFTTDPCFVLHWAQPAHLRARGEKRTPFEGVAAPGGVR
jgi:hypothetical protein